MLSKKGSKSEPQSEKGESVVSCEQTAQKL